MVSLLQFNGYRSSYWFLLPRHLSGARYIGAMPCLFLCKCSTEFHTQLFLYYSLYFRKLNWYLVFWNLREVIKNQSKISLVVKISRSTMPVWGVKFFFIFHISYSLELQDDVRGCNKNVFSLLLCRISYIYTSSFWKIVFNKKNTVHLTLCKVIELSSDIICI